MNSIMSPLLNFAKKQKSHLKQQGLICQDFENLIESRKAKGIDPVFTISEDFAMGIQLGHGAFAAVYKATHKQTGYEVALKTYEKSKLNHRS